MRARRDIRCARRRFPDRKAGDQPRERLSGDGAAPRCRPRVSLSPAPMLRRARKRSTTPAIEHMLALAEQNLGNVLVDLGRYDDALRHLRAAERIQPAARLEAQVAHDPGEYRPPLLPARRAMDDRCRRSPRRARSTSRWASSRRACMVDMEMLPTYIALNLREESSAVAERAVDGMRQHGMPLELGQSLLSAGRIAEAERRPGAGAGADRRGPRRLRRDREPDLGRLGAGRSRPDCWRRWPPTIRRQRGGGGPAPEAWTACRAATGALEQAGTLDRAASGRLVEGACWPCWASRRRPTPATSGRARRPSG